MLASAKGTGAYLSVDKVVRAEHVADGAGLDGVENTGLKIDKDGAGDIAIVAVVDVRAKE